MIKQILTSIFITILSINSFANNPIDSKKKGGEIKVKYKKEYLNIKEFNKLKNAQGNEEISYPPFSIKELLEEFERERAKEP
jgi:hypothetical protein